MGVSHCGCLMKNVAVPTSITMVGVPMVIVHTIQVIIRLIVDTLAVIHVYVIVVMIGTANHAKATNVVETYISHNASTLTVMCVLNHRHANMMKMILIRWMTLLMAGGSPSDKETSSLFLL